MHILAIETSCDETSAAVISGEGNQIKILSNIVGSQIKIHAPYGGVVPELAARRHAELLLPVISEALKKAGVKIDVVAATYGPGLVIALFVGLEAGKILALAWGKPFVGVNHLEGHLVSVLGGNAGLDVTIFDEPLVALVVSGGHTELVLVKRYGEYQLLGRTKDDAAGEAFDKVAGMLGLPYPGGPEIAKAALQGTLNKMTMPRPMMDSHDYNFSFAGLKTHVLYLVKKLKAEKVDLAKVTPDIALAFEDAITDVLVAKTMAAALAHQVKSMIVSGGVASNARLRQKMLAAAAIEGLRCYFPPNDLNCDNAAMIGIAGYLKARYNRYDDPFTLRANPNLKFS